jgi:hypothetical protein
LARRLAALLAAFLAYFAATAIGADALVHSLFVLFGRIQQYGKPRRFSLAAGCHSLRFGALARRDK